MASNEWIGVVNTTAPKFLKGAADQTIRKRLLLAMLERRGRLTFNNNSISLTWDVQIAEPPVEAYGDGGVVNYARRDLYRQLTIDSRGYVGTDAMTEKEKLMNDGDVAIVRRYDRIIPTLTMGIRNKFGGELYVDGNASGNENRLCGAETFLAETTPDADDIIAAPNDVYGGSNTDIQDNGGTWSQVLGAGNYPNDGIGYDWPEGSGDSEFDALSPKLANWSSTGWGTASTGWADNCERVIRRTVQWLALTAGAYGAPNCGLMAGDMMTGFKNKMAADRIITIPHPEASDLGFPETLLFEGLALKSEFGIAVNTAYIFNTDEMELMSLDKDLFSSRGPAWDPKTYSYLFSVGFFGNMKYRSPRYFAKLKNYA